MLIAPDLTANNKLMENIFDVILYSNENHLVTFILHLPLQKDSLCVTVVEFPRQNIKPKSIN